MEKKETHLLAAIGRARKYSLGLLLLFEDCKKLGLQFCCLKAFFFQITIISVWRRLWDFFPGASEVKDAHLFELPQPSQARHDSGTSLSAFNNIGNNLDISYDGGTYMKESTSYYEIPVQIKENL